MKITLAKTAGFCFGVNRAVDMALQYAKTAKKVCTLGPIIHNENVVNDLKEKGVGVVQKVDDLAGDELVIIRSHGVAPSVFLQAKQKGAEVVDATCPYVAKIHKIVSGTTPVLIAGDKNHEEVKGIMGHAGGEVYVFQSEEELVDLVQNHPEICQNDLIVVSQTTFNRAIFEKCIIFLKKVCTKAKVFDTICKATAQRQDEARALAKSNDAMVVIGSKTSSNTVKLFDICSKECKTYFVTSAAEIDRSWFKDVKSVGVVAGASTPAFIIKEVIKTMSNENTEEKVLSAEITDDMSFEEALEASLSRFNTDQKVKGVVLAVTPTEIQVDIGRKQTGYVPADEYSTDNVDLQKEVKVGDELDLVIMKVNDVEGTVMLSKKRYDRNANWNKIQEALDSGEVLEGTVKEAIKGGMIIKAFGYDIFVPASQASVRRNADLSVYVGKEVPFKIIEIRRRRNIIGSCKAMLKEQEDAAAAKIWESIAVGDKYMGTVKSLTGFGAFVDIGGVDGMVHISELSWQRIKHPSEVVNVGDTIEVYVKALDTEKKKISLGYKKADENPWTIFLNNYNIGDTINVEIANIVDYGAFAHICTGVDGLIHVSQISYDRVEKPQDVLSVGQKVDVKITDIDLDKKRVSLSIKALLDPPKKEEVAEEVVANTESGEIAPEVLAQAEEQAPAKVEEPAAEAPAEEAAPEAPAEEVAPEAPAEEAAPEEKPAAEEPATEEAAE